MPVKVQIEREACRLEMVRRKTPLFLRFAVVGGLGVFVNTGILYLLHGLQAVDLATSSMVATECAIIFNFFMNNKFTFEGKATRQKLIAFNLACICGLFINTAVLIILAQTGMFYLVANIVGILAAFASNYLMSRYFVWKGSETTTV